MPDSKNLRGRPPVSDTRRAAVREQIIASARTLFLDQGFDHVSMRKVAQKTGLSPTSLYQYFPSKRHILHCLWAEIFARVSGECLESAGPLPADPVACIRALMVPYMAYWIEHPDHFRVIFMNEDLSSPPEQDLDARHLMDRMPLFQAVVGAIDQGICQGLFPRADVELVWQVLFLHCHGTVGGLITIREIPFRPKAELIAQSLEITLRGLTGAADRAGLPEHDRDMAAGPKIGGNTHD